MRSVSLAVLGALVLAASAQASLPKPPTHRIVPGKSIGGVKLGMKLETAVEKWGKGSTCDQAVYDYGCEWSGSEEQGNVRLDATDGTITAISINVGQMSDGTPVYGKSPLKKLFHTKNGVTIGTTQLEVSKKFKRATPDGNGLSFVKPGVRTGFSSSSGRTSAIYLIRDGA